MADLSQLLASIDPESDQYGDYLSKLASIDPNSSSVTDAPAPMPVLPVKPLNLPAKITASNPGEDAEEDSGSNLETPSNTSSLVQDAIKQKYGFGPGLDDNALMAAQQAANSNQLVGGIGAGIDRIISGLGHQSQSAQAAQFYQNLGKSGEQNVQNILQRRQGQIQNQALAKQQELQDPNSPQSQAFQNSIKKLYPDVFSEDDLKNISAEDMDLVFKPLALKEQIEARKAQLLATRQFQQTNKDIALQQGAQTKLNADKEYSGAIDKASDVDELMKAANLAANGQDPNGLARNLIATKLVPAFTGLKRVNTPEFQSAAGSQDVASVINRLATKASSGGMDQNDYKQLVGLIGVMKDSADASKSDAIDRHVNQYLALPTNKGKSREQAAAELGINLPASQSPSTQGGSSQRINVLSPSGKKGTVPMSQLQDALAQGYKQVS